MLKIKAVSPYVYPGQMNFKDKAFKAWLNTSSTLFNDRRDVITKDNVEHKNAVTGCYPRFLHKLMFNFDMPNLWFGEARLCFVQPVSLYFDTFFTALSHEIIPFIWDCWPCYFDKLERWLKRHKVKSAIFTSRQEMEEMRLRLPRINYFWCPEGIDSDAYNEGKELANRSVDLLEFGRSNDKILKHFPLLIQNEDDFVHITTMVGGKFLYSDAQLSDIMQDAKMTICVPRSMTHPEIAGNIETLTQRYWEAMLSRMVIVGHAPQELIDVCGYNPVLELDELHKFGGWDGLMKNISNFQGLVDKNRKIAIERGDWKIRMTAVKNWLESQGYVSSQI